MTRTRRTLAVLFATAAATAVTALPAHAADTGPVVPSCATGYVCLNPSSGPQILIPEGKGQDFPGGIKATIANRTKLTYCVGGGSFNFSVAPGGTVTELRDIRAVGPMPPGGACLH